MPLPNDIARCHGVHTSDTVRPIDYCRGCERWKSAGTGGPRTPYLQAPACIRTHGTGAVVLVCDQRIAA